MTGIELKERLLATHIPLSEIARRMGIKPQDLNALFNVQDSKTGTLEKLAKALEMPIAYFYGDSYAISGNNNATNHSTVNASDDRLLSLLASKDEQLSMAMRQTSKAQEQMDRLMDKYGM